MSKYIINQHDLKKNYTVFSNNLLQSKDLSTSALGLLIKLLSLPCDWKINMYQLQKMIPEGRKWLQARMKELIDSGYVKREIITNQNRTIVDTITYVNSSPIYKNTNASTSNMSRQTQKVPGGKRVRIQSTIYTNTPNPLKGTYSSSLDKSNEKQEPTEKDSNPKRLIFLDILDRECFRINAYSSWELYEKAYPFKSQGIRKYKYIENFEKLVAKGHEDLHNNWNGVKQCLMI